MFLRVVRSLFDSLWPINYTIFNVKPDGSFWYVNESTEFFKGMVDFRDHLFTS